MSYTLINNSILEDNTLSHTEFRVLLFLIRNHNKNLGYSFPTKKLIAEKCNMSKDTVDKVIKSLEKNGYITKSKSASSRNNVYYIKNDLLVPTKTKTDIVPDETNNENIEEVPNEVEEPNNVDQELMKALHNGDNITDDYKETLNILSGYLKGNKGLSFEVKQLAKDLDYDTLILVEDLLGNVGGLKCHTTDYIKDMIYDAKARINRSNFKAI